MKIQDMVKKAKELGLGALDSTKKGVQMMSPITKAMNPTGGNADTIPGVDAVNKLKDAAKEKANRLLKGNN